TERLSRGAAISLPFIMRGFSRLDLPAKAGRPTGLLRHHGIPALAMQAGVRAALLEGSQSLSRRRPDRSLPTINSNMVSADARYESSTPRPKTLELCQAALHAVEAT